MGVSLVAMRCRTSDRTPNGVRGVDALAPLLGERLGIDARSIGTPTEPRSSSAQSDLRGSRGCLLEAGGQVDDALDGGDVPVLLASECSIALTTLPTVLRHRPDARVLWLDAHGDFNTPQSSTTGYLGGMGLAGACGRFDPGLGFEPISEERIVLAGVRDLDAPERVALAAGDATVIGASPVETLVAVKNALDGAPVYIHLDLDVIDPEYFPAQFPVPDGLVPEKLYDVLEAVADSSEIVGIEITAFEAPEDDAEREAAAAIAMHAVEPLMEVLPEGSRVGS